MGEANEFGKSDTIENGYPRDLLQRFMAGNSFVSTTKVEEEDEETEEGIELNLGLSLGGCFGVNPSEKTRLVRSSSIAGLTNIWRDEDISLIRTCSLPVPNEDEKRKRKELQSLRRLEAKRKRSEKQRNWKLGKDRGVLEGTNEEDKLQHKSVTGNGFSSAMGGVSFRPPTWGSNTSGGGGGSAVVAGRRFPPPSPPPPSQPAGGLQRSTSSGVSEIESRQIQGLNNCFEARSSMNVVPELAEQKPVLARTTSTPIEKTGTSSGVKMENPSNDPPKVTENGSREMGMKMMEEMPCVTTTGNGPNGKRIEGFLYKYRKGEEVRIVCVCHGSFLSPAEFVKHAGGGDVENPLRHITISQSSSTYV